MPACWGDLSVVGNELQITIPEKWLGEAKYPVVVDPTIGTTTVGSQYMWDADPPEPMVPLMCELQIPVNRFLVSDTINGNCTAYVYTNSDDIEAGGRPVLYSDNGNKPLTRKSVNENLLDLRVTGGKPKGWRTATFTSNGSISSGSYIWFGVFCEYFWFPRFDYGAKCYFDFWDLPSYVPNIPNTYPIYNVNWYQDFRLSMYFTYTSGQNYQRTLTQGVSLSDSRIVKGNYKRTTAQTVRPDATPTKLLTIFKRIQDILQSFDLKTYMLIKTRRIQEVINTAATIGLWRTIIRSLFDIAGVESKVKHGWVHFRKLVDRVQITSHVFRGLLLFVRIFTGVHIRDYVLRRFLRAKAELVIKSHISREIVIDSPIR